MWKHVILAFALAIMLLLLFQPVVNAATTADVTITATGIVVAAPGGFTITYVSDYEVNISWTKPVGADKTMIRAAFGRMPTSITDGYEVYYGTGNNFNDSAASLATPDIVYYKAWSQTAAGAWSPLWATADTGGLMSLSFLFIAIVVLTIATFVLKQKIMAAITGLGWAIIGIYLLSNISLASINLQLGIFSMIMSSVLFMAPIYLRTRIQRQEPVRTTRAEQLDAVTKRFRELRGRSRIREGWWQKQ